jgi:cytochrome P450 family 2 subfamily J
LIQHYANILFQNLFNIPIINVLWQIVAGSRYEYSDPKFKEIITMVAELMSSISPKPSIAFVFPFLRDLFPSIDPIKEQTRKFSEVSGFLKSIINEHKKNFDSENINDFIDAYLAEIKKTKDDSSSFHESEAYEQLTHTLIDLFFAGSETTSSTLAFAILFMIRHNIFHSTI